MSDDPGTVRFNTLAAGDRVELLQQCADLPAGTVLTMKDPVDPQWPMAVTEKGRGLLIPPQNEGTYWKRA